MYLSFMSSTLRAVFSGSSSSSQPCGLPVSTEQNRQARVHTAPINMMVAVPAFQHSPMFGHLASSHTVASRCSRTMFFTALNPAPAASGAVIQLGFPTRAEGASAARDFCPSLMAVKPCGVTYFSPLRGARFSVTTGMFLSEDMVARKARNSTLPLSPLLGPLPNRAAPPNPFPSDPPVPLRQATESAGDYH